MKLFLFILVVILLGAGAVIYYIKKGKIADRDGDLIPDVVEDTIEDVKEKAATVKRRAKAVKKEIKDVGVAIKEVAKQSKDVVDAAKGKKRKGRKPRAKNKNMSKYNLTDILEQYRIGSGFTTDFDYEGMLKAGLETGVDTDIEKLKAIFEDFTDVNYHREAEHLSYAIDALEEGAIKEASMFFGDFHAEIKSTMETFDMEIPDTLGAFMASKMDVDESFDSLAKKLDKTKRYYQKRSR